MSYSQEIYQSYIPETSTMLIHYVNQKMGDSYTFILYNLILYIYWLVGLTILKNMKVGIIPYIMENKIHA